MVNRFFILVSGFVFILGGCTTVEFVRKDFTPRRQAVLKYAPPGSESREIKYRIELNKQATNFCSGEFDIAREFQAREETGSSAGIGTGFGIGSSGSIFVGSSDRSTAMYNFVEVVCK